MLTDLQSRIAALRQAREKATAEITSGSRWRVHQLDYVGLLQDTAVGIVEELERELNAEREHIELQKVALRAASEGIDRLLEGRQACFKDRTLVQELEILRGYFRDTTDIASDWPCLPECDNYGHRDGCPHTEPAYAFRKMMESNLRLVKALTQARPAVNSTAIDDAPES